MTIRKSNNKGLNRELFLLANDFKTCYTVNFPKIIQIFEAWKPTKEPFQTDISFEGKT